MIQLESIAIAKKMAFILLHDNGMTSRFDSNEYGEHFLCLINAIDDFTKKNGNLLDENTIDDICIGDQSQVMDKYGDMSGFIALNSCLESFINNQPNIFLKKSAGNK